MKLKRYRDNNSACIEDEKGRYCLSEDVEKLEEENEGWISIEERLPEYSGEYICALFKRDFSEVIAFTVGDEFESHLWNDSGPLLVGRCPDYHKMSEDEIIYREKLGRVTHWRIIPSPPKAQ
tara:strand:- start:10591 stop:10956 length:366 start_codon:yes stop_codon:yes gene_type:complete